MGAIANYFIFPFSGNPAYQHVTQDYGPAHADSGEPTAHGYLHWHLGIDYNVPSNTPIEAAADGIIIHAGPDVSGAVNGGYGICVAIDHGDSFYTIYGHFASLYPAIVVGVSVKQGQIIGFSDSSGNSSGPHLHFGVFRVPAVFGLSGDVNPTYYMSDTPDTTALPGNSSGDTLTPDMTVYLARHVGIPTAQLATCVAIAMAESGLQVSNQGPRNSNNTYDYGLWQINSVHKQYDKTKLLTDAAYNAQAMADISSKGTNWTPWATYNNNAYLSYIATAEQAVKETPSSTRLSDLVTSISGTGAYVAADSVTNAPLPPALPPNPYSLVQVNVDPLVFTTIKNHEPTAYLWIKGIFLPVISCDFTQPTYRTPGSFTVILSTNTLLTTDGQIVMDDLHSGTFTQVVLYLGYVQHRRHFNPSDLTPVFTGLANPPQMNYGSYQATLSGPDLSGLFSDPSSTAVDTKNLGGLNADQAIQALIDGHASRGIKGIQFKSDPVAGSVQAIFGQSNDVITRGTGQTEWDTMVAIADGEGAALWFQGTTLHMQRVPASLPAQVLYYGADRPASLLRPPIFHAMKHLKRSYNIKATSYDTVGGTIRTATSGNSDASHTVTVAYQPNISGNRLQKFADSVLQQYDATQYQASFETNGMIPLLFGQPIVVDSVELDPRFTGRSHPYFPASITYSYSESNGISMAIKGTNYPLGIQTRDTLANLGL